MTSAVLDRVLAIPDYDLDLPQMGLSNNSWAIVAATGKTKDGSPAKASVLKQERKGVSQQDIKKAGEKVGIKGDRAISSEPRIVKNNANTKDLIAVKIDGKSVSVPSGSEFVAVKDNHIQSQIVGQRAYRVAPKNGTQDDYIRETVQGQYAPVVTFKTPEQALKYAEKLNRAVAKKQKESPKAVEKPANRKLTPEIATKAKSDKPATKFESKLKDEVATTAKYIKTRTNDPRLIQNAIDNTKAIVIDKLVPKIRAGNKKILNPLREKRAIGAYKGKDIIRRKKRAMSEGDISRNAGIASAKLESQGQLNLFNQPKRSAAIAPDTAKKVKRAISGVKGGKVVKGQNNQVPTTKVKEGKTFKSFSPKDELRNGFQNATIQVPLRDPRTGAYSLSKPMKGEKIGDFHVSGSKDQGYSVTHIPTGFKVVDTIDMKNSMGDNDINTARRLAKTFDKAKISNVLPKSTARANKIATNRRLMSGMKPAQQKIKAAIAEAKESAAKEMLGKSGEKDRLGRLIYDRKGNEIIYK